MHFGADGGSGSGVALAVGCWVGIEIAIRNINAHISGRATA